MNKSNVLATLEDGKLMDVAMMEKYAQKKFILKMIGSDINNLAITLNQANVSTNPWQR